MKPYWRGKGFAIFHGDSRKILPTLPNRFADLIVADPPYGANWQSNRRRKSFDKLKGDEDTSLAETLISLALPKLKMHRHIYVFGRYDLSKLPLSQQVELIWDKEIKTSGNLYIPWGKSHEYIQFAVYVSGKAEKEKNGVGRLSARLRKDSVIRVARKNSRAVNRHSTEKPTGVLRQLIESSSCLGEIVLDFSMGSGSTLEAAFLEDRRAIGIELEERNCEIAAKRMEELLRG